MQNNWIDKIENSTNVSTISQFNKINFDNPSHYSKSKNQNAENYFY